MFKGDIRVLAAIPFTKFHVTERLLFGLSIVFVYLFISIALLCYWPISIVISYLVYGGLGVFGARAIHRESIALYSFVFSLSSLVTTLLYFHFLSLYGSPYWGGGSDELEYERLGKEFALGFGLFEYSAIRNYLVPVWHNSVGYIYFIGIIAKLSNVLGTEHTMIYRLANAMFLGQISILVYALSKRLKLRSDTSFWAAIVVGVAPLMMWTAAQTLRDILVSFLLLLGVFLLTEYSADRRKLKNVSVLLTTLIVIFFLVELRRGQAFVLLLTFTIGLFEKYTTNFNYRNILFFILFGVVLIYLYLVSKDRLLIELDFFFLSSDTYSAYRMEERGGGLSNLVFLAPPPFSYILRFGYALITPLPVLSKKLYVIWLSLGTIFQIFFIPFFLTGLKTAYQYRRWWIISSSFLLLFFGMALLTFTTRHITQFFPLAVLISGLGFEAYKGNPSKVFLIMGVILTFSGIVYGLLKLLFL